LKSWTTSELALSISIPSVEPITILFLIDELEETPLPTDTPSPEERSENNTVLFNTFVSSPEKEIP